MLHSKTWNKLINRIHKRVLRSDYKSSINEILHRDDSFTIHQINVQSLAIEILIYLHGLSATMKLPNKVFKFNETVSYDLRMHNELYARN